MAGACACCVCAAATTEARLIKEWGRRALAILRLINEWGRRDNHLHELPASNLASVNQSYSKNYYREKKSRIKLIIDSKRLRGLSNFLPVMSKIINSKRSGP